MVLRRPTSQDHREGGHTFSGYRWLCHLLGQFSADRVGASFFYSRAEQWVWGRFLDCIQAGEPRRLSLCLGVSGFDGRGREGVYGKELPNSSPAFRAPLQKVSEVSPTPRSNARNQLGMTSFS